MPNIFVLPFYSSFGPTRRADTGRPISSGPLVGLLSLSLCLLAFPGAQALADDHLQPPTYGGSSYAARNRPQPASAPVGKTSSGVPWYADQAQRRQAAAAASQVERPAYDAHSYASSSRSRQVAAARKQPLKPAVGGEAPSASDRSYLATAQAEDFGWKVPAAWRGREMSHNSPAHAVSGGYSRSATGGFLQQGVASWYGGRFNGRQTASGERYNQNELTAAHKTLPFGSLVEVTNHNNGRNVVVRINDRGPFYKGRVIDLSRGAAQMLDIDGIAQVTIKVVSRQVKRADTLN